MAKATKEAKVHTSWVDPVADYDQAVEASSQPILADEVFVADLTAFLADSGWWSGGVGTLWPRPHCSHLPGVPDIYQGSETWDLSLVDPDNRRPVDYDLRRRLLAGMRDVVPIGVAGTADEGRPKLWLIHALLQHRRRRPELYLQQLRATCVSRGACRRMVGFDRGGLAVVVPRLGGDGWDDTTVQLPAGRWTDVLTGADHGGGRRRLGRMFPLFPVAILARSRRDAPVRRLGPPGRSGSNCVLDERSVADAAVAGWMVAATVREAGAGSRYGFCLDGGPGRPDPRSASQPEGSTACPRSSTTTPFLGPISGWRGVAPRPGAL